MGRAQLLYSATEGEVGASEHMDTDVMPDALKAALEATYRDYAVVASSPAGTPTERREVARRSGAVAVVFRDMAAVPGLEWWIMAALATAAEAFQQQAQDWNKPRPWAIDSRGHAHRPRLVQSDSDVE